MKKTVEEANERTNKNMEVLNPQLDAFFAKDNPEIDLTKRHGYIVILISDSGQVDEDGDEVLTCVAAKADIGHKDVPTGFHNQLEYGGFLTPMLTLLHNSIPDLATDVVERVGKLRAATELLKELESAES